MFNMSPEKFSEIAEDLDPAKPLNVNKWNYFYVSFIITM